MPAAVSSRLRGEDVLPGAYLRKGRRLVWVAAVFDKEAALESVLHPDRPLDVVTVRRLVVEGWELVRGAPVPAPSGF